MNPHALPPCLQYGRGNSLFLGMPLHGVKSVCTTENSGTLFQQPPPPLVQPPPLPWTFLGAFGIRPPVQWMHHACTLSWGCSFSWVESDAVSRSMCNPYQVPCLIWQLNIGFCSYCRVQAFGGVCPGMHWEWGEVPHPPPPGRPAYAQPLSH